ncbi:MAG: hypothetical protein AVDCRST_MAG85-2541, partial [uncultured Solirubrobacteraceae bacterium]
DCSDCTGVLDHRRGPSGLVHRTAHHRCRGLGRSGRRPAVRARLRARGQAAARQGSLRRGPRSL